MLLTDGPPAKDEDSLARYPIGTDLFTPAEDNFGIEISASRKTLGQERAQKT